MIYTVTFNPSLDYIVRVDSFKPGVINRTCYENILPGGKGINVSIVLSNLGHKSVALGFMAGFTGDDIAELMKGFGCGVDLIRVRDGFSRINVKLKSDEETEINGQGPLITAEDIDKLYEKLDSLAAGDILVISGSVPGSLPRDVYERITERLDGKGIRIVVDAEKDLLVGTLRCHPWLVKPNERELGGIYGVTLRTQEDVAKLRRHNGNATENSCHLYGTTIDICYNRYQTVEDPGGPSRRQVRNDSLKFILSEVLNDMRQQNRCFIKYEVKQGCFHMTVR